MLVKKMRLGEKIAIGDTVVKYGGKRGTSILLHIDGDAIVRSIKPDAPEEAPASCNQMQNAR